MDKVREFFIKLIELLEENQLLSRAFHTFWQAALPFVLLGLDPIIDLIFNGDWSGAWVALLALLGGAIGAGAAALRVLVKSSVQAWVATRKAN